MSKLSCQLQQDRKGMIWDLLLYVATVAALALISFKLWYSGDRGFAYLLFFLASLFFFIGSNRILSTRLMLLPKSPVAFNVEKEGINMTLRNGDILSLVKDVRYFPDYAEKSFGLSGQDLHGRKHQFVFHKGQFKDLNEFKAVRTALNAYK